MDSKVSYTAIGIFVIGIGVATIYFILWLSTGYTTRSYEIYTVYVKESVSGLSVQSNVKYNGVNVGYVDDIALVPDDPDSVKITVQVESSISVHENTTATLRSQGLTGITYIDLEGGTMDSPLVTAAPGEKYPVIKSKPSLFAHLENTVREIADNLDVVTEGVRDILSKSNQMLIHGILSNIEEATKALANNADRIDQTLADLAIITENTSKASERFPAMTETAEQSFASLRNMADDLSKTGQELTFTLKAIRPQLHKTLQNVSSFSMNLQQLSKDLERNPSMLIRGQRPAKPGPGE